MFCKKKSLRMHIQNIYAYTRLEATENYVCFLCNNVNLPKKKRDYFLLVGKECFTGELTVVTN